MKKPNALIVMIIVLVTASLMSSCQAAPQKAEPSEKTTAAAAQTSTPASASQQAATASSAPSSGASASAAASPAASTPAAPSLSPAKPSLSVISPLPSLTVSPAKPSLSVITPEVSPRITAAPGLVSAFQLEEKTYKDGVISIKYPQITGYSDKTVQDKLNKLISDSALRDVKELKGDTEITAYEITDTVSLNTPAVISIYFDGYMNRKQAAHPNQFFYSVTIDVKKLQTVALSQLISVTPDFVKKLPDGTFRSAGIDLTNDYVSAVKTNLKESDAGLMLKALKNADMTGSEVSSYLTKDSLGISVGLPHVMGDHIEILFKFSQLHGFQTDNLLWKDIEK